MALTAQTPIPGPLVEWLGGYEELLATIRDLGSVKKLLLTHSRGDVTLWVVLREDNRADSERIFELEYDLPQPGDEMYALDLRVVSLDHIGEDSLPLGHVLFDRS